MTLWRGKGFGPGTLHALSAALAALMDGWRERLAGDVGRAAPVTAEARETLQEGLDELAALFGISS